MFASRCEGNSGGVGGLCGPDFLLGRFSVFFHQCELVLPRFGFALHSQVRIELDHDVVAISRAEIGQRVTYLGVLFAFHKFLYLLGLFKLFLRFLMFLQFLEASFLAMTGLPVDRAGPGGQRLFEKISGLFVVVIQFGEQHSLPLEIIVPFLGGGPSLECFTGFVVLAQIGQTANQRSDEEGIFEPFVTEFFGRFIQHAFGKIGIGFVEEPLGQGGMGDRPGGFDLAEIIKPFVLIVATGNFFGAQQTHLSFQHQVGRRGKKLCHVPLTQADRPSVWMGQFVDTPKDFFRPVGTPCQFQQFPEQEVRFFILRVELDRFTQCTLGQAQFVYHHQVQFSLFSPSLGALRRFAGNVPQLGQRLFHSIFMGQAFVVDQGLHKQQLCVSITGE